MKTLEEEASDWCMKKDEEIGEYWSNDFEELPIQIADFTRNSKWVQAEKIRSKIELLKDLGFNWDLESTYTHHYLEELSFLEQQLKELDYEA